MPIPVSTPVSRLLTAKPFLEQTAANTQSGFAELCNSRTGPGAIHTPPDPESQRRDLTQVAFDLHDGVAQWLAAAIMDLEAVTVSGLPEGVTQKIVSAREKVRRGLAELRAVISALQNDQYEGQLSENLLELVTLLVQQLRQSGVAVRVTVQGNIVDLSGEIVRNVGRIIQEAVFNAFRHSESSSVWLSLVNWGKNLQICVRDFGKGWCSTAGGSEGLGLRSMEKRVNSLGGWILIESAPERGTRVFVSIPCEN